MKRFLTLLLSLALLASLTVPAVAAAFTDVPDTSPYADAVRWAAEQNIALGTSLTTFGPKETCSKFNILTFLWRASGRPGNTGNERAAVTAWAAGLGIDASKRGPAPCTRSAAVTYIWKSLGSPAPTRPVSFSDVPAAADYAQAVAWAVENGVTQGTSASTFSPNRVCTRGQIVTFLYRALDGASDEPPETETVPDAGPVLTNGKPITDENVIELLNAILEEYPKGTIWCGHDSDLFPQTKYNIYGNSDQAGPMLYFIQASSPQYACSGWAAMCDMRIYGSNASLPFHKVSIYDVRPGDVIIRLTVDGNDVEHYMVAMAAPVRGDKGRLTVEICDGNCNERVNLHQEILTYSDDSSRASQFVIWSRRP